MTRIYFKGLQDFWAEFNRRQYSGFTKIYKTKAQNRIASDYKTDIL